MNRLSQNVMGLSEFPDTLPLVILHFGGDIGDRSLCVQGSLIRHRCRWFRLLFENCLYGHSHQGLVMVGLLDNFLNPLKLFLAVTKDFPKSP
jgi:cellulose synthase/poly-beta-1,6-N-acetylglucosamine synthase-like glycosyltransferase